jgi:hypothetical protein
MNVSGRHCHALGERPLPTHTHNAKRKTLTLLTPSAIFTGTTTQSRVQNDLVTNIHADNIGTDTNHNTGSIATQDMRERHFKTGPALSNPYIQVI